MNTKTFLNEAKALTVKVGDFTIPLPVKPFSKGSVGWHASIKIPVKIGEDAVMVQFNLMGTVIGSKDYEDSHVALAASQARVVAWKEQMDSAKTVSQERKATKRAERAEKQAAAEAKRLEQLNQTTQSS